MQGLQSIILELLRNMTGAKIKCQVFYFFVLTLEPDQRILGIFFSNLYSTDSKQNALHPEAIDLKYTITPLGLSGGPS